MGSCQVCRPQTELPSIPPQLNTYPLPAVVTIQKYWRRKLRSKTKPPHSCHNMPTFLEEPSLDPNPLPTDRSTKTNPVQSEPQEEQEKLCNLERRGDSLQEGFDAHPIPYLDGYLEVETCLLPIEDPTKFTGQGFYRAKDGSYYQGEWKNGLMDGQGQFQSAQDGSIYTGTWLEGLQNGHGVEHYRDRSTYEGNFQKGMKHGYGKFCLADGSIYEGHFKGDKFHGKGNFIWDDGQKIYDGEWVAGVKHGFGRMEVVGKFVYEGEYRNGQRNGKGHMLWADGREFTGQWKNGQQHGKGQFSDKEKVLISGVWRQGVYKEHPASNYPK